MARVQIDLPERFVYSTRMQVFVGDLAGGFHLGNHILISYCNEVLFRFLRDSGLSNLLEKKNAFINADLAVVYKSESSHWDLLRFDLAVAPAGGSGFELYFRVTNETTGREAAHVKMAMLFFDYGQRKISKVPDGFEIIFHDDFTCDSGTYCS